MDNLNDEERERESKVRNLIRRRVRGKFPSVLLQ